MSDRDCWRTSEGSAETALIADIEVPGSDADALRALADRLDADPELCLIGVWVMPERVEYIAGTRLQAAVTRLTPEANRKRSRPSEIPAEGVVPGHPDEFR